MMRFLANENFPRPSIAFLRDNNIYVKSIAESYPGISDEQVMKKAIEEERTIVTHEVTMESLFTSMAINQMPVLSILGSMYSNQLTRQSSY